MLNETWLKNCVDDHEIIRDKNFNIYRNDRTQASHPSDPNNPNKFKKFGGGVLIAIRSDIQADVKRLSVRKGAEILAIKVSIDNKKFVFCTLYRVGNLDEPNHASIIKVLASARGSENKKKKIEKKSEKKSKKSCQCLYMFFMTQRKKSNLRQGLNHVPIN